nr:MAG: coat protein [Crogonang virus 94]
MFKRILQISENKDSNQMNTSPVILVEEWCNHYKIAKPDIIEHSSPKVDDDIPSKCAISVKWRGKDETFSGTGVNKKASKFSAYKALVDAHNIQRIVPKESLFRFCKQKIQVIGASEMRVFDGKSFLCLITIPTDHIQAVGRDEDLEIAIYTARADLYNQYQNREEDDVAIIIEQPSNEDAVTQALDHISLEGEGTGIIETLYQLRQDRNQSAVGNMATSSAGLSAVAQPNSQPPPPIELTPQVMSPARLEETPTTMLGQPTAVAEQPNLLCPPDMLSFSGRDFTILDLAYRQCVDHTPQLPINQLVPRGTILAVDAYDPTRLNPYIRSLADLHTMFVGAIEFRYHLIGQPVFMGELYFAWLPDIRNIKVGDILPDEEYQKYAWKTAKVNDTSTTFMLLDDARLDRFVRTTAIDEEDATMQRPGLVVGIYQAVVNPFDNKSAACYLNIGSRLSQGFRFSDPKASTTIRVPPTGDQSAAQNSLAGNAIGTIFSEYGLDTSLPIYMSTDGNMYPILGAPTETPSTRDLWQKPTAVYPPLRSWINDTSQGNAFRATAAGFYPSESSMVSSDVVQQLVHKQFATDHKGMYMEGEAVVKIFSGGNGLSSSAFALSAPNIDAVYARLVSSPGWDGATRTNETRTVSYTSIAITSKACINAFIDGLVLKIFFFDSTFGITAPGALYFRLDAKSTQITISATGSSVFQYSIKPKQSFIGIE